MRIPNFPGRADRQARIPKKKFGSKKKKRGCQNCFCCLLFTGDIGVSVAALVFILLLLPSTFEFASKVKQQTAEILALSEFI